MNEEPTALQNPHLPSNINQLSILHTVDGRNPANQLIWWISHNSQGFIHPRWCRISSIKSITHTFLIPATFVLIPSRIFCSARCNRSSLVNIHVFNRSANGARSPSGNEVLAASNIGWMYSMKLRLQASFIQITQHLRPIQLVKFATTMMLQMLVQAFPPPSSLPLRTMSLDLRFSELLFFPKLGAAVQTHHVIASGKKTCTLCFHGLSYLLFPSGVPATCNFIREINHLN